MTPSIKTYKTTCDHCGTEIKFKMTPVQYEYYRIHTRQGYTHEEVYRWATEGWDPGVKKVKGKKK